MFRTKLQAMTGYSAQMMTHCQLLEVWKDMGRTQEGQDLFCDITMEADRVRAETNKLVCEIPQRLGKGDPNCRLILRKK